MEIGSSRADYLLHTAIFLPWMILVWLHINQQKLTGSTRLKIVLIWFSAGVLLAVFSEGIQLLLPYRSFNVMDVLVNVSGVVVGGVVFLFFKPLMSG